MAALLVIVTDWKSLSRLTKKKKEAPHIHKTPTKNKIREMFLDTAEIKQIKMRSYGGKQLDSSSPS